MSTAPDTVVTVAGHDFVRVRGRWITQIEALPTASELLNRIATLEDALQDAVGRQANLEAEAQEWGFI